MKKLEDDVFYAKKRSETAKEVAQKAEADGEPDAADKKAAAVEAAKKVTEAEVIRDKALKTQGK